MKYIKPIGKGVYKMKYTKEELETIIRFNEADPQATIYTCNQRMKKRMKSIQEQRPEGWTGTSRELLDAGKELLNAYIAASPNEITKKLVRLDKSLFEYDGITHTSPGNGNATKRHKFMLPVDREYKQTTVLPI